MKYSDGSEAAIWKERMSLIWLIFTWKLHENERTPVVDPRGT